MERKPVVAGQFYPGDEATLNKAVDACLSLARDKAQAPTLLAMVPHAGYVFSGGVCGRTLASASLADTILLLGPNHTGLGRRFAVWDSGVWNLPGIGVPIDVELADSVLASNPFFAADHDAHLREHSLEVILPFLHRLNPEVTVVPVSVSEYSLERLEQAGRAVGRALKTFPRPVSIVVSSDMSHYISHDQAKVRDSMALDAAVALDPENLFRTVKDNDISMCGVLPMTLGLFAALEMGATRGELVAYATSGDASGDYSQVVGYAGVLVS